MEMTIGDMFALAVFFGGIAVGAALVVADLTSSRARCEDTGGACLPGGDGECVKCGG